MSRKRLYNPDVCDLCGSRASSILLQLKTRRSMRSDRKIVCRDLCKVVCDRCGMVRSGQPLDAAMLEDYYVEEYMLSVQPEHYFYTPQGAVSRSKLLCDWMVSSMGASRWQQARRCLEVGAGAGALLYEFAQRFPEATFEGIELNKAAAELAQQRGLRVCQAMLEAADRGPFDIVYAVAVIEHCPSPTNFLKEIRKRLRTGGWLFLVQPTQDVASYDLFFIDHLYHFGSQHLSQYARKCGFRERGLVVGHEWMPNFSLHLWQATDPDGEFAWVGPPGFTTCPSTAQHILSDLAYLDATLAKLSSDHRRVAVFGLNEAYWLARAYSSLGDFPLLCGLDDAPDKPEYARLGFPVMVPEQCVSMSVQDVILTMNAIYYDQTRRRLEPLGLAVHPLFREAV